MSSFGMRLPFCNARCDRARQARRLPSALALGSYLKSRAGRKKSAFVTPPPDSMGP